jgi:hypothetical protein
VDDRERPPLLSIGIAVTAAWSLLSLLSLLAVGFALALGAGISLPVLVAEGERDAALPVLAVGALGVSAIALLALVEIARVAACWGAWRLRRGFLIALLVITVVGLVLQALGAAALSGPWCCCCAPLRIAVDLVLFAGIVQALSARAR